MATEAKATKLDASDRVILETALEFYKKSVVRAQKAATVIDVSKAYSEQVVRIERLRQKMAGQSDIDL